MATRELPLTLADILTIFWNRGLPALAVAVACGGNSTYLVRSSCVQLCYLCESSIGSG